MSASSHIHLSRCADVVQLLMYATKNADKDTKEDQENDTRVDLMQAFSSTVSELCETHICLTKHPYFVVSKPVASYSGSRLTVS